MISFEEIKQYITENGLKPTSQREMPLYTLTCIFLGYTKILKKILGYSYEVVGAVGGNNAFHSLFNENRIAEETGAFVDKNYTDLDTVMLNPAQKIFQECQSKFAQLGEGKYSPKESLRIIDDIYPTYMACIGIYNCLWRYIGNDTNKGKLTTEIVQKISNERDIIAKFYPKVEKVLKDLTFKIGTEEKFDGDLLRYLTHLEMVSYANGVLEIQKILSELSNRRENYFYIYIEKNDREEVVTDKNIIKKIKDEFYSVKEKVNEIKGFVAYKGTVKGKVLNLMNRKQTNLSTPTKNSILVTSMTHPDDIALIKQCCGIVTDEGGILSHAAIIARELKKPCIIGTKIATQVLKDGDVVEMDAEKGVVRII